MVYTEVIVLKSRRGKALESVRDAFPDADVKAKKTVVRQLNGRVIIYDFKTWKAQFWRPGTPGNRHIVDIIKK